MKSVSDVLLVSICVEMLMDFGTKFEPSEDDTLLEILKCATPILDISPCILMHFSLPERTSILGCGSKNQPKN